MRLTVVLLFIFNNNLTAQNRPGTRISGLNLAKETYFEDIGLQHLCKRHTDQAKNAIEKLVPKPDFEEKMREMEGLEKKKQ